MYIQRSDRKSNQKRWMALNRAKCYHKPRGSVVLSWDMMDAE